MFQDPIEQASYQKNLSVQPDVNRTNSKSPRMWMTNKQKSNLESQNKYNFDRKLSLLQKHDTVDHQHLNEVHNAEIISQSINVVKEQSQNQREKRLSPTRYTHVKSKVARNLKTQKKVSKQNTLKSVQSQYSDVSPNKSPSKKFSQKSGGYTLQQTVRIVDSPTHQKLQEREDEIRRTEAHLENLKSQLSQTKSRIVQDNMQTQSQVNDIKFSQSAYTKPKTTQFQNASATNLSNPYYQPSSTAAYTNNFTQSNASGLASSNVSPYQPHHYNGGHQTNQNNLGTISSSYNQSSSLQKNSILNQLQQPQIPNSRSTLQQQNVHQEHRVLNGYETGSISFEESRQQKLSNQNQYSLSGQYGQQLHQEPAHVQVQHFKKQSNDQHHQQLVGNTYSQDAYLKHQEAQQQEQENDQDPLVESHDLSQEEEDQYEQEQEQEQEQVNYQYRPHKQMYDASQYTQQTKQSYPTTAHFQTNNSSQYQQIGRYSPQKTQMKTTLRKYTTKKTRKSGGSPLKQQHNFSPIKTIKKNEYAWIKAPNELSTLDHHGFKVTKKVKEGCANIFYDPARMKASPSKGRAAMFMNEGVELNYSPSRLSTQIYQARGLKKDHTQKEFQEETDKIQNEFEKLLENMQERRQTNKDDLYEHLDDWLRPGPQDRKHKSPTKRLIQQKESTFITKQLLKDNNLDRAKYSITYCSSPGKGYNIEPHGGEIDYSMAKRNIGLFYDNVLNQDITKTEVQKDKDALKKQKLAEQRARATGSPYRKKKAPYVISQEVTKRPLLRMIDSIRDKLVGMLSEKIGEQFRQDILDALKSRKLDSHMKEIMRDGKVQLQDEQGRPILQKQISLASQHNLEDERRSPHRHRPEDIHLEQELSKHPSLSKQDSANLVIDENAMNQMKNQVIDFVRRNSSLEAAKHL